MSKVSYIIELTIQDGKLDEFKNMANGFINSVKENEANTLGYQWFLGQDQKKCILQETFTSSEALLTHLGNVGPTLPDLMAIAPITRLEVLGKLSDDAQKALAGLNPVYFSHFGGFDR